MNKQILLAKIRGRGNEDRIRKVIIESGIFDDIDTSQTEIFAPERSLDIEEWFLLENYSSFDYQNYIIDNFTDTTNHLDILDVDHQKLDYLCCIDSEKYFFQKITTKSLVTKKWLDLFGDKVINKNKPILVIGENIDAVYDKSEDKLYFKNLSKISSIFKGIDQLYREATDEETIQFLENDFISLSNDHDCSKVKTSNRKRIAMASDTLNSLSSDQKNQVFSYIKEYCPHLSIDAESNSFSVSCEDDLKNLLYGIERRFYKKAVTNEPVVATSIQNL